MATFPSAVPAEVQEISRLQISCQSFQVNRFISKQVFQECYFNVIQNNNRIFVSLLPKRIKAGFFWFFLMTSPFPGLSCLSVPFNYSCIPLSRLSLYSFIPVLKGGEHDAARRPWIQKISLTRVQPVTSHPDPYHLQRSGQDIHCNKCLDKGWYVELDIISLLMFPWPMNDLNQRLHADILRNFKLEKLGLTSLFQWTDSD